ncbi:MAG TPA: response regulator [Gemmatimonadales bacterium]|nr:response regulator [Gemmatimonadales bacterium]
MTGTLKRRILLADDQPDVVRLLAAALTEAGYEVVTAADGAEAVRRWREINGGDLVILDILMPRKDGLESIIELRTHSPGVPIIAMSGGGSNDRLDILGDAKMLGAMLTIKKPFHSGELVALVTKALPTV